MDAAPTRDACGEEVVKGRWVVNWGLVWKAGRRKSGREEGVTLECLEIRSFMRCAVAMTQWLLYDCLYCCSCFLISALEIFDANNDHRSHVIRRRLSVFSFP